MTVILFNSYRHIERKKNTSFIHLIASNHFSNIKDNRNAKGQEKIGLQKVKRMNNALNLNKYIILSNKHRHNFLLEKNNRLFPFK